MKVFTGKIISAKMQGIVTIVVQRHFRHPLYRKILKKDGKILAANQIGAVVGDEVTIVETRPIAKTVCFKVKEILTKNKKETAKAVKKTAVKRKVKKEVEK